MLNTLQRYVLREVLIPTLLTLGTLTFILLVRIVFSEADEVAAALSLGVLLRILGYFLPSLLTLAIPMAVLTGVLLGVGRLTVDGEIKACRTHGLNLYPVFAPVLACGVIASLVVLVNSFYVAPHMLTQSLKLMGRLKIELINSLEAGKFVDLPSSDGSDIALYFAEKDPETGQLKNVYLWVVGGDQALVAKGRAGSRRRPRQDASAAPTSPTLAAPAESAGVTKTIFVASTGEISTDSERRTASLILHNASIHVPGRDRNDPRYVILESELWTRRIELETDKDLRWRSKKKPEAMTAGELGRGMAAFRGQDTERARAKLSRLRAEVLQRLSISMACFVFVVIGLPLAVYIRPSGKSVGISIAFMLLLLYYGVWHYGGRLVREDVPFGSLVVFFPNVLLTILGFVMLHRTVHR